MATVCPLILALGRIGIGAAVADGAGLALDGLVLVAKGSRWAEAQPGAAIRIRSARL
jgi:hypothetical protein